MGKWSKFKKDLKKLPPDTDRKAKLSKLFREKYLPLSFIEKCATYKQCREIKKEAEASLKDVQLHLDCLSDAIEDELESAQFQKVNVKGVGTFYLQDEPHCSIEDSDKAVAWAREKGHDYLVTLGWQRLNAVVKTLLEEGKEIPEGVKVFMKTSVKFKK